MLWPACPYINTAGKGQKAVSAHFTSKQILSFDFADINEKKEATRCYS